MEYECLTQQSYSFADSEIVPIRMEDIYSIMDWRNEQMYHLRQSERLTTEKQERYFEQIVKPQFTQQKPAQILFSYIVDKKLVGYGGLVHINWIDRHAEISFLMDTNEEKNNFHKHWKQYLAMIEQVAFEGLDLHKIFTYAFDLRPHLYDVLEEANYNREATLKDHCIFEGKFLDVIIHTKINSKHC